MTEARQKELKRLCDEFFEHTIRAKACLDAIIMISSIPEESPPEDLIVEKGGKF